MFLKRLFVFILQLKEATARKRVEGCCGERRPLTPWTWKIIKCAYNKMTDSDVALSKVHLWCARQYDCDWWYWAGQWNTGLCCVIRRPARELAKRSSRYEEGNLFHLKSLDFPIHWQEDCTPPERSTLLKLCLKQMIPCMLLWINIGQRGKSNRPYITLLSVHKSAAVKALALSAR